MSIKRFVFNTARFTGLISLLATAILCISPAFAQTNLLNSESSITSDTIKLTSGSTILDFDEAYVLTTSFPEANKNLVHLDWDIESGYYLYRKKYLSISGYIDGEEVEVNYQMPDGLIKYDELLDETVEVYFDQLTIPISFPDTASQAQLKIRILGCKDKELCYPPQTKYLDIDFGTKTAGLTSAIVAKQGGGASGNGSSGGGISSTNTGAPNAEPISITSLLYLMLLALVGGMILNLMPCVFPVLSLKALSFISTKGSDHSHHLHGWVYTAGVVASFMVMGGIIIGIRAAGGSADWGMQLQSPIFVTLMVYLFLVMGLSLSGFVHFGSRLMGIGQSLTTRQGLQGSFFTGVLAVVVASPCSAPFMATALGVALTQSPVISLTIFASLGLGLALPFLILSHNPKLASYLPKPGAWMETLKQVLAFPLYLTAAAGLWVLGRQTSTDALAVVVLGGILLIFAIWLMQKQPRSIVGKFSKFTASAAAVVLGLSLGLQSTQFGKGDYWQEYSPELVDQLLADGQPVFINMTAAWCTICHTNELVALSRNKVKDAAEKYNVAMVKGDYTNENPNITKLLNLYQRPTVPLYLMFSADGSNSAEILPQVLTADTVIDAMERATKAGKLAANDL